jgi:hypothetical protein
MNYNPTPKHEYLRDAKMVAAHRTFVQDPILRRALETAQMEMHRRLSMNPPPDWNSCAAAYLRSLGVSEFLNIFYGLAEDEPMPQKAPSGNLSSNIATLSKKN